MRLLPPSCAVYPSTSQISGLMNCAKNVNGHASLKRRSSIILAYSSIQTIGLASPRAQNPPPPILAVYSVQVRFEIGTNGIDQFVFRVSCYSPPPPPCRVVAVVAAMAGWGSCDSSLPTLRSIASHPPCNSLNPHTPGPTLYPHSGRTNFTGHYLCDSSRRSAVHDYV